MDRQVSLYLYLSLPANTLSSQILLTNLFLLLNDLPSLFGPLALAFTLFCLPPLFAILRELLLPRYFPNFTHTTDLWEKDRNDWPFKRSFQIFNNLIFVILKLYNYSAFIQSLQLQTSKVKLALC